MAACCRCHGATYSTDLNKEVEMKKCACWTLSISLITLFYSPLDSCDRNKKNENYNFLSFDYLWQDLQTLNNSSGGWGYPQSADINSYDAECYPWISGNGKFLLFCSINFNGPPRPGHQGTENWDIYISEWDSVYHRWGSERNLSPVVNTLAQEHRPSCTPNCDTLYFERDDDIYMSILKGKEWTTPEALLPPVNTKFGEWHPAISPDGKRLYFTSNRPDSLSHGGSDIWVAHWNGIAWTTVENMGEVINTPSEETRPFESFDGQRFYFSSNHGEPRPGISFGSYSDIYISTRTATGWGPVTLVEAPVNCDLPACSPCESPDGNEIWFGSEAWEGSRGDEDIWVATKGITPPPRITTGYGKWRKTGELLNAILVYDLKEGTNGTIYAATACAENEPAGKVFKTTNGGISWTACAGLPGTMVVYSLLVENDTLYAGTYPRGDVFKSIDGGTSWINTADVPDATAARRLLRLRNGDILVATSPYDETMKNRIYRTKNGGKSWAITGLLPQLNPCKFLVQTSSGAIYAGGWGMESEIIIHKSSHNGVTWDSLTVINSHEVDWTADGFYESIDGTLYVSGWIPSHGVGTPTGGYVCKSTNQGTNWTMCTKIVRGDRVHSGRIYSILQDQFGTLYAGMQPAPDSVVFASSDGGNSWFSTGGLDGAYECLCLLHASDGSIYAGTSPNGDVFRYTPEAPVQVEKRTPNDSMDYQLYQNFPNPFNSETTIGWQLARPGRVTIKVYDILGQYVTTIIEETLKTGMYEVQFNGMNDSDQELANGVYIYRMEADDYVSIKKFLLIK